MSLDVYFREDTMNILRAVAHAHGPMGDEAAQVLEAVAAGFGIEPKALGIARRLPASAYMEPPRYGPPDPMVKLLEIPE